MTDINRVEAIIMATCMEFGVRRTQLLARRRDQNLMPARMAAATALRQLTDMSYSAIGDVLHREHASVISLIQWGKSNGTYRNPPCWMPEKIARIASRLPEQVAQPLAHQCDACPVAGVELYGDESWQLSI